MSALCQTYAPQQNRRYSITSSARSMIEAGTTRPSDFAVCRFRVGGRTGRSAGLAPLRPDGVAIRHLRRRAVKRAARLREALRGPPPTKQYVGAYARAMRV